MKILLINKFLYLKGGDAISTLTTGDLLSKKGHKVFFWGMKHPSNPSYLYSECFIESVDYEKQHSIKQKLSNSLKILYSFEAKGKIEKLVKEIKPDIVHLNNFAHQISPSILNVFRKYNIPTVMTMHDYKLVCASYSMLVDGKLCERCKGGKYYFCFLKKCVKDSRAKSLLNTLEMYLHQKLLNIYSLIDVYISPSMFLKNKVGGMGFKQKVEHLPNFINVNDFVPDYNRGDEFCYFGRLSKEKGLFTLIQAMKGLEVGLKIIGTGPEEEALKQEVERYGLSNIRFLGHKAGSELKDELKRSIAIIIPSEWYENNPRTVLEAFALGKPVIGARIGGIPELVKDGETGYTFEAGNTGDLRGKINRILKDKDKIAQMGKNGRRFVEESFNSEKHYQKLMNIYQRAIEKRKRK